MDALEFDRLTARPARDAYRDDPDDPALIAAALDEALFFSDEALERADEALALIEARARRRVYRRRELLMRKAAFWKYRASRYRADEWQGRRLVSTSRMRSRESHRGRPGHARRATATSGTPPGGGDDPPAGSTSRRTSKGAA